MKKDLNEMFKTEVGDNVVENFQNLVKFIDASLVKAYSMPVEEKNSFLVKTLFNLRDFMSSEIVIERTKKKIKSDVESIFDKFVKDHDLNLKELEEIAKSKIKKKELESEVPHQSQENLLETDQSTLLKEEEN